MLPQDDLESRKQWTLIVSLEEGRERAEGLSDGIQAELALRRKINSEKIQIISSAVRDPWSPCLMRVEATADDVEELVRDLMQDQIRVRKFAEIERQQFQLKAQLPVMTSGNAQAVFMQMVRDLWGARVVVHFNSKNSEATVIFPESTPQDVWPVLTEAINEILIELNNSANVA